MQEGKSVRSFERSMLHRVQNNSEDVPRVQKWQPSTTVSTVFGLQLHFISFNKCIWVERLRWAGHVARMGESRNAYRVLVGRPEGKRPLGRPRCRWEDNIRMDLREVGYDDRDWIDLAQDRDQWQAYVRAAMNLRVPQKPVRENPQTIRENAEILVEASKAIGLEVNPEKTKYMIMSRDQNIVRNGTIKIGDLSFEEVEKFKYLGATVTNINDTREEIKRRINMGNACYYSVEKLSSSSLLSKKLKIVIYKTVILPVVLYGCETWTLTLREEQRLRVFENKVLRKIFGAKRDEATGEWRKLHNGELHALYSSPDIIRNIKSRRLRWAGHVSRMGESRNAYRVLVGRPEGKDLWGGQDVGGKSLWRERETKQCMATIAMPLLCYMPFESRNQNVWKVKFILKNIGLSPGIKDKIKFERLLKPIATTVGVTTLIGTGYGLYKLLNTKEETNQSKPNIMDVSSSQALIGRMYSSCHWLRDHRPREEDQHLEDCGSEEVIRVIDYTDYYKGKTTKPKNKAQPEVGPTKEKKPEGHHQRPQRETHGTFTVVEGGPLKKIRPEDQGKGKRKGTTNPPRPLPHLLKSKDAVDGSSYEARIAVSSAKIATNTSLEIGKSAA
ncbi:hypothetical protein ANN_19897 [Periplaneta americana]|uniref:Reverse transcriptase domain-containing protein n=1 Tax=Periplaneta americana TaxID=6978 RepID=A0ABQ8SBU1_PERAM|nr:hypothetical protein ANN_19897 [Periplaneta americana]